MVSRQPGMHSLFRPLIAAVFGCSVLVAAGLGVAAEFATTDADAAAEQERFFESEVRPLLIAACGECHGAKKAESGLRLDIASGLHAGGDSGPVLDLEAWDQSLLLRVIQYDDDIQMPPDGKLADAQIEVLRRWVQSGAPWPSASDDAPNPLGLRAGSITEQERQHWAYQPIIKPPVPALPPAVLQAEPELAAWADTDIDRFVLAAMVAHGLRPTGDANKRQWLRRLSFDLIGLPPTPEELAIFISDDSPQAYSDAIDRLLHSTHYGQRWGRHWLDLVRYADTAGDGADYPIREAYRYRDYVIDAFNHDKPYDQFIQEQIAGDILAHRAAARGEITAERFAEQIIATGYIAITKRFGYNINNEFQHLDIADTLDNLGQVFFGLSIGCARCHDHKYDAMTAEDYYALYGIFASSQYSFPGGEEHKRPHHLIPLALPSEVAAAEERVAQQLATLDEQVAKVQRERQALLADASMGVSHDPGLELQSLGKPPGAPWFAAGPNTVLADAQSPYAHVCPPGSRGVRIAHGAPTDGIRQTFADITVAASPQFHFNVDFRNVAAVEGEGGYRFYLGHGAIVSLALECSINSNELSIRNGDHFQVVRRLEPGDWYNLQLTIDLKGKTFSGTVGHPGDVVAFENFATAPGWDGVLNTFVSDGFGRHPSTSPTRDLDNVVGQLEPFAPLPDSLASVRGANAERSSWTIARERLEMLASELGRLEQTRADIQGSIQFPRAYGVTEGTPANARLQRRGEPDRLGDEVPRRFLEVLGGDTLPPDATGSGRLELAQWLTRADNPLTARVLVNRVWQQLFGRGLVATPNDFGVRGQPPSHPELLDFLAAEFMADGWSIKRLQRRIMSSHVYRLASGGSPEQLANDPENRWLSRHRRRGLDAESIRDAMLAVSGQLDDRPSGAHPFPDVNSWNFTIHYPFHATYDSQHRSVYLMIQRARRHPFLTLFDAADPNISTAVRQSTVTPTQSLYLMNAPFVHAQAAGFADRLLEDSGYETHASPVEQAATIVQAYLFAFGRPPSDGEIAQGQQFLHEACTLLSDSESVDAMQVAWEAYCRVLLTSNEFLYVD